MCWPQHAPRQREERIKSGSGWCAMWADDTNKPPKVYDRVFGKHLASAKRNRTKLRTDMPPNDASYKQLGAILQMGHRCHKEHASGRWHRCHKQQHGTPAPRHETHPQRPTGFKICSPTLSKKQRGRLIPSRSMPLAQINVDLCQCDAIPKYPPSSESGGRMK